MKNYQKNLKAFQEGRMTLREWQRYCTKILMVIMKENRETFVRLKYRA